MIRLSAGIVGHAGGRSQPLGLALPSLGFLVALLHGAPATGYEVSLTPEVNELVLGQRHEVEVRIVVHGEGAEQVRGLRLSASIGSISAPRADGPGRWRATYHTPGELFPQAALIVATAVGAEEVEHGVLSLRLLGRRELGLRTDPGAQVTITFGERSFGPVRADREGSVHIPVEVPPGLSEVTAHSVDEVGNRTTRTITLAPPSFPRLLVGCPTSVVAAERVNVVVAAIDRSGELLGDVELVASRGRLQLVGESGGALGYTLEAPEHVGGGDLSLRAVTIEETPTELALPLTVVPGRADGLELRTSRDTLIPGSDQVATIRATVVDRFGNPRPGDPVQLIVSGATLMTAPSEEGGIVATVASPPTEAGLGELVIEARALERFLARTVLRLVGGPATLARIEAPEQVQANGETPVRVSILLVGETGLPSNDVPNVRASSGELGQLVLGQDGWWTVDFVPDRARLGSPESATIEVARGPAAARARIRLTPPVPWLTVTFDGGFQTNAGALIGPSGRLALSTRLGLRRGFLELGLSSGLFWARLKGELARGSLSLDLIQVPLSVGFGYGLHFTARAALLVTACGGALFVAIEERAGFQPESRRNLFAPLVEGAVEVMLSLGRGEFLARVGFGYSVAPEGSGLRGNMMGLSAMLGYRLFVL